MDEQYVTKLKQELVRQWVRNHSEFCEASWPHEGTCNYPLPKIISDMSQEDIIAAFYSEPEEQEI